MVDILSFSAGISLTLLSAHFTNKGEYGNAVVTGLTSIAVFMAVCTDAIIGAIEKRRAEDGTGKRKDEE